MTTLSNVNIVLQQGNAIKDAQNVRHQPLDANQLAAAREQREKDVRDMETVTHSDESGQVRFEKEGGGGNRDERRQRREKKDPAREAGGPSEDPDNVGRILDTLA